MHFGEFLVKKEVISQNDLKQALMVQRFRKKKLGRVLKELGLLNEKELNQHLEDFLKPSNKESVLLLQKKLLENKKPLSEKLLGFLDRHELIFLEEISHLNAYALEFNDTLLEEIENVSQKKVTLRTLKREQFDFLKGATGKKSKKATSNLRLLKNLTDDDKLSENTPYAKLFRDCLFEAKSLGASDIHIQPQQNGIRICFRLFGKLQDWKFIENQHREVFTQKLKWILGFNLALFGTPQDARASLNKLGLDIRGNLLPTIHGEKIVCRLLRKDANFDFSKSLLPKETKNTLLDSIHKKDGLILISGPTGSGKTTTLYSLLSSLDRKQKNISTLENPVEYELSGITQVNIENSLSFADGLRGLMRQDPDVILVGEIRDEETAELALRASATGHLVLSTIHANGSIEAIQKLQDFGIKSSFIESNLRVSCAQRLVSQICPHCSSLASDDLKKKTPFIKEAFKVINPKGCSKCHQGIIGRIPIMELAKGFHIKAFFSSQEIQSFSTLSMQALNLAKTGKSCLKEALEL